jgi:hypothetical protein
VNNLEVLVDLERFSGLSLVEIEAVKTESWPHVFGCDQPAWKCEACHEDLKAIRRVIASVQPLIEREHLEDLEAAGRLLPEGATLESEFVMRWYLADEKFVEWGSSMLAGARDLADGPPVGAVRGEIRSREHWAGPWSVVEPVAVKEGSDGG